MLTAILVFAAIVAIAYAVADKEELRRLEQRPPQTWELSLLAFTCALAWLLFGVKVMLALGIPLSAYSLWKWHKYGRGKAGGGR